MLKDRKELFFKPPHEGAIPSLVSKRFPGDQASALIRKSIPSRSSELAPTSEELTFTQGLGEVIASKALNEGGDRNCCNYYCQHPGVAPHSVCWKEILPVLYDYNLCLYFLGFDSFSK